MAIENINDYAGMWANGVNIGQLWDKIKEKFVSGAHVQSDATTYPASWKQQARANIGLTIGANKMWYGSAANTIGEVTTSTFGRGLLNTSSGTEITGLFAETAEKDKNGIEISENYAHSLAITEGYLRLKNNRYVSGAASAQDLSALQLNVKLGLLQLDNTGSAGKIPLVHIPDSIMGQLTYGGTITAYTQSTDSLTVSITTGAKAILEQKTGRTIGNKTVKLVATATDPSDTSSIAYFNYTDCTGIYFIWTAAALTTHTGEPDYRVWPSGGPRYQAGDWLISNDTKWDKVDNTDAVTGVKGSNESAFRLGNVSIDALDVRALATYLTNTTQTVADKVQFNKDIWSLGGVAAYGISDLSAGGGGGGGLSGTIIRNWSNYQGAETEVLGANLGMRGFRMSGYSFQVNKPAVNTDNWQTEFTLGTENIPDLPLTQITGTDDLQAIEALTATSGFLKKTAANTWALATDVVTLAGQQALTNKTYNGYTLAAACAKDVDTSITASSTSTNLPTSKAVADMVAGAYLSLSGGTMANTDLVTNLNAEYLGGTKKTDLFSALTNDNEQLSATIGTTNKKLTLDYAKKTSRMRTEIKADQEFVYRQSPQTIDADSLVINKFKGRTVAWNQRANLNALTGGNTTRTLNDIGFTSTAAAGSADKSCQLGNAFIANGHSYYLSFDYKSNLAYNVQDMNTSRGVAAASKWTHNSKIGVCTNGSYTQLYWYLYSTTTESWNLEVKNVTIIDLTRFFNGNIPENLTPSEFEQDYDIHGFYKPNAGQLINNDAKQFESVGFNVFNNHWNACGLQSDGSVNSSDTQHKHTDYIRVNPNANYYLAIGFDNIDGIGSLNTGVYMYDACFNFISKATLTITTNARAFTTASNCAYLRFDAGDVINKVANLNLSDPAKNGTYEPYRRIVTDLNLGDIKVKSHNIWDEEWEMGSFNANSDNTDIVYVNSTTQIRCVNYIPIEPNTLYYYNNLFQTHIQIAYFDRDKKFLGWELGTTNVPFSATSPSNACYLKFRTNATVTSYTQGQLCINEYGAFNGNYEPFGIITIKGIDGVDGVDAGYEDTFDEIIGNKLIKRYKVFEVTSSTPVWMFNASYVEQGFVGISVNDSKKDGNVTSTRYIGTHAASIGQQNDKSLRLPPVGALVNQIGVKDTTLITSGMDAASARNALLGIKIVYELATPIEYELASPIPDTMPAGTTERIISDRLPVTPFACDMTYGANPKDILASAVPFSRLQGVRLERGAFTMSTQNDSNWYLVTLGDKKLYLRFTVNTGAFKLEMASDDTENPEYSKSFEFATLSTSDINEICV